MARRDDDLEMSGESMDAASGADELEALKAVGGVGELDFGARLTNLPSLTVAFPPCTNELLALVNTRDPKEPDDFVRFFHEYFKFGQRHSNFGQHASLDSALAGVIDAHLLRCLGKPDPIEPGGGGVAKSPFWPSECCICTPCVRLEGNRNPTAKIPEVPTPSVPSLKRLFVGDAVWLFWMGDRLGVFQILGAILDSYAHNGSIPISNGSLDPGVRDDVTALVLEIMVRQMKQGLASSVRDRAALYRTSLGWNSPLGQKLNLQTQINAAFNTEFHKFIYYALEYYRDRRLAAAIQTTAAGGGRASVATLTTIGDTIDVLKRRFEAWNYGRNMYHTLSGVVWTLAGMSVIRELRTTLGIPSTYVSPEDYIPAAYDLLIAKRPITHGNANRYVLHRELARNGRDLLLDMQVLKTDDRNPNGELDQWLTMLVESKVEAYRTAYRTLTNVDLGSGAAPAIEQQA